MAVLLGERRVRPIRLRGAGDPLYRHLLRQDCLRRFAPSRETGEDRWWWRYLRRLPRLYNSISVVQTLGPSSSGNQSTTFTSSAFASATTTGNAIIVGVGYAGAGGASAITVTVADTVGNTYTQDRTAGPSSRKDGYDIWRSFNITGGASFKIKVTPSASGFMTVFALEVSGLGTSATLDGGNTNFGDAAASGNTTVTAGSFSTAAIATAGGTSATRAGTRGAVAV